MHKNKRDRLELSLYIVLALLGIYIAYQILRALAGGSWAIEDIILSLVIFNIGLTGALLRTSTGNKHDIRNMQRSFNSLARDFKEHRDNKKVHN
ncbi:MAG TPA: hypothetical protein VJB08_06230 [Candidatus Nanoarchaeia archaeon]|nr:hypothetical protein [Candidatus Nanoarchaeia archaeon]